MVGDDGAVAGPAVDADRAMMQADEAFDDGKAKPRTGSPSAIAARREAVEHALQHVLRNARTLIRHREHEVAFAALAGKLHGGTFGCEIDSIGQELDENLLQPLMIGHQTAEMGGCNDLERNSALLQPVGDLHGNFFKQFVQIVFRIIELHDAGIDGREIENIVDDGQEHRG